MLQNRFLCLANRNYLVRDISWSRCRYFLQKVCSRQISEQVVPDNDIKHYGDNTSFTSTGNNGKQSTEISPETTKTQSLHTPPYSRTLDRNPEDLYRRYLMKPDQPENPHLIRVAIIGAPNAGKSSLVNSLMGWKVNAVSKKVHTTRSNTNAMFTKDNTQIIFVDTPGVLTRVERKRHRCDGKMLTDPERSLEGADVVGVIVDSADKWTRYRLHPELIKVLHLHKDIRSFLILNKIDELRGKSVLKQQRILLGVTSRLADGKIGGKEFGRKITERKKERGEDTKSLFDRLEKKYGEMSASKKVESNTRDDDDANSLDKKRTFSHDEDKSTKGKDIKENIVDKSVLNSKQKNAADLDDVAARIFKKLNIHTGGSYNVNVNRIEETKQEDNTQVVKNDGEMASDKNVNNIKFSQLSHDVQVDNTEEISGASTVCETNTNEITNETSCTQEPNKTRQAESVAIRITEKSYQSDFLAAIQSRPTLPEFSDQSQSALHDEEPKEDFDWTEKVSLMKEAIKSKGGWGNFDEVFLTSAVDGTGIDAIREYLVKIAKPGNWVYHSSVVTDQHPYDIAKMCVTQSLLDNMDSYLPYVKEPEIMYWDVDEHNRLNISVELKMANTYEMNLMLGGGSRQIQAVSSSARQALMDAFQCEVRFKMAVVRKRGRT